MNIFGKRLINCKEDCYMIGDKKANVSKQIMIDVVLHRIEYIILNVTKAIARGEAPVFRYANRSSWDNIRFDSAIGLEQIGEAKLTHVRFDSINSVKKFGIMVKVLSLIYKLIQEDKYCTKRDIYYQFPELFGSQSVLDSAVDNLACMLEVPRWELHVLATSKGCVAGDLQFYDAEGQYNDCQATRVGIQIPAHSKDFQSLQTNARYVLIVEKDATFQKLLLDNLCDKYGPCIMITGKGFPDMGTRMLLRALRDRFQLPMFALVDADPHGVEIMAVYKFGSKAQAAENCFLAVPEIRWLGVLPSDIQRLNLQEDTLISMTKKDMDKACELLGRPYVQSNWQLLEQIQIMIQSGKKAEIQCLDSLSSSYLCQVYIPEKLASGCWL
ncbi:meiotic recombination protein SPO11-like isoform X2 [Gigantopelta aegis]|uniref:meiotic recombination protein SPO11-like isoform X2 n=1 Tax=Gigantopelta aegis TaxID=1735272 RepID=UPI001B88BFE2|nr:meiotic recombination protein SPO11-like isoform X2 [Gigantopelta aegis]